MRCEVAGDRSKAFDDAADGCVQRSTVTLVLPVVLVLVPKWRPLALTFSFRFSLLAPHAAYVPLPPRSRSPLPCSAVLTGSEMPTTDDGLARGTHPDFVRGTPVGRNLTATAARLTSHLDDHDLSTALMIR